MKYSIGIFSNHISLAESALFEKYFNCEYFSLDSPSFFSSLKAGLPCIFDLRDFEDLYFMKSHFHLLQRSSSFKLALVSEGYSDDDYNLLSFCKVRLVPFDHEYSHYIDYSIHKFQKEIDKSYFSVNFEDHTAMLHGVEIADLTRKELLIIKCFISSSNFEITKEMLLTKVWDNVQVNQKTLDVHLYNLRQKLKLFNYQISYVPKGKWSLSLINSQKDAFRELNP